MLQQKVLKKKQDSIQLPSSQAVSPASRSVRPGSAEAVKMTVTSGRSCLELSKNSGVLGLLEKMLLGSSTWRSTRRYLTWKAPATKQGRLYFRLVPSAPRIKGCAASSSATMWATPTTIDHLPPRSPEALLRQAATTRKGRTQPGNLREQVDEQTMRLWPTVVARDYKGMGSWKNDLTSAVLLWPTPVSWDAKDGMTCNPIITATGSIRHRNKQGGQSRASLSSIAKLDGGQLNPAWVEWLMGFPIGWTELSA